jgi:CheY-like chemotaxis protein
MELEALDLNELTRDLMKLLGRLIPESVEIEFLPAPALHLVDADPGQVEQVLVNLCVNARDAMPQGGLLTVTTDNVHIDREYRQMHPWAKLGSYVKVTVSDTGVGMTSEVRERLFEPFFTTKHPGKGTGLGLATVYGIVEQHRGFLHVSSEPAAGTVFEVYLPVTERRSGALKWNAESEAMGGHETILVAEDEEAVRNIVVRILEEAGYRVLTAVDGADAVRTFRDNEDVDLVILDVIMPKASGPLAYEEIRTLRPSVPVLFTSGYSDAASFKGVSALALRLVQKPYEPQTLLTEVRSVLDEASRGRRRAKLAR